jgi:hypothetical protein
VADLTAAGMGWEWTGERWAHVSGSPDLGAAHVQVVLDALFGSDVYHAGPPSPADPVAGHAARAARYLRTHGWPDAEAPDEPETEDGLPEGTVY